MKLTSSIVVVLGLLGPSAAPALAAPLQPIQLTQAGADSHRVPFARWAPDHPIVNIRVSTRPTRMADGQPAIRYWEAAGSYGRLDDGPAPEWLSGDGPLVPGLYYTSIQGDGPSGPTDWTPSHSFRVKARHGEWTGPTSQKRYLRFTRSRTGALRGLALSVYAPGCTGHASLSLPGSFRVHRNGTFSATGRGRSRRWIGTARVRVSGRIHRHFARGVVRVDDLFEGCGSGRVSWSARLR
jgi:hypothetical protein